MSSLDPLFTPKSIALVGASAGEETLSGIVLKNLLRFRGSVYPVTPRHRELMGRKAYPSIGALPETVDLAVIMRPAREVEGILGELRGRARCAVVVSAGFAETGAAGLQEALAAAGREAGVRLLGPNCLGVYNPRLRLDTFFLPRDRFRRPGRGNVAVVSQSGAILVTLLEALGLAGSGVSKGVNYGNAADIDAAEIFDHLARDRETEVVLAYLESVGDGRRFVQAARGLDERKPLIVLKAGQAAGGQAAAFSHTGRLAGRYEVFRSIMAQFGIREAGDFDELLDAAKALSRQRPTRGEGVCVITNGGGFGVLAADECLRRGLTLPPLPDAERERLKGVFPPFYVLNNPIDLTGQVRDEDYRVALDAVRDHFDGFLVIALTGVAGITPRFADLLREFRAESGKPMVLCLAQGGMARRLASTIERGGIPVYPTAERAARALRTLLEGTE